MDAKKKIHCPKCGCGHIRKNGFFVRIRNRRKIQRYQCWSCLHTFSDQTFDKTYRQKRPDLIEKVLTGISNGVGIRRSSDMLHTSITTIQRKIKFLQKICESFHVKHMPYWKRETKPRFQFDEMWSIEKDNWQALTLPVVVEKDSHFIVSARATYDYCRSNNDGTKAFYNTRVEDELKEQDKVLKRAIKKCILMKPFGRIVIDSDKKTKYQKILGEVLGERLVHNKYNAGNDLEKRKLFPVNNSMACLRAEKPMLRRESWYITKDKNWLNRHLSLYIFYYNYIRIKRYTVLKTSEFVDKTTGEIKEITYKSKVKKTPAQHLKIFDKRISVDFLLAHC